MSNEIITTKDTALQQATRNVKPPLRKSELLLATAMAMHKKYEERREELHKVYLEKEKALHDALVRHAYKLIKDPNKVTTEYNDWRSRPDFSVDLTVVVGRQLVAKEAEACSKSNSAMLPHRDMKSFLAELRAANAADNRALALVADEDMCEKLAKAGAAILNKADEKKGSAINV